MTINKKAVSVAKPTKAHTGINGLDEITDGGLPKNRITIISGNAGCGKTVMSMEFLVNGAVKYNEPGVFISFEETNEELASNMQSLNFEVESLIKQKKIYLEYLEIDKAQFVEAGKYDLEGLFVRLQNAINSIGAKRVVLDSLDALFYGLDIKVLRPEIKRLFKWLREKGITALITSEIDNGFVAKYVLEKYVADCVIVLDNRVVNQVATRRLRIVKMRGSVHGINEYPFIIDDTGMSVLPLISELKNQNISDNRITTGIIYVLKSRGMNHSTQVRGFVITNNGINLLPIYLSPDGVLTGSAKLEYTLKEEQQSILRENRLKNEKSEIARKRKMMEENIAMLKVKLESEVEALNQTELENDIIKEKQKKNLKEITDLRNNINSSFEKSKSRNK